MTTTVSRITLVPDASEAIGQLPLDPWIVAVDTQAVVAALQARGTAVRFVGGCVRDSLARRPVHDVDIATPDRPETVIALLEDAGLKAVPTGLKHGTVTAVSGDETFEVTTLRCDVKTDGRHAKVAFTEDWLEDAKRRDLTINAMSAAPGGAVYDPFDGISDLAHGRVRFVGRARERVEEDHLRILRFFRFFGDFGRPPMDKDGLAACRASAEKLTRLSGERLRDELLKIMVGPDPANIAMRMRSIDVFDHILPEAGEVTRLRSLNWLETRAVNIDGVAPDAIRHLAALLDTDAAGPGGVAERLRLSNMQADRLRLLCTGEEGDNVSAEMGEQAEQRLIRRIGAGQARDLMLLAWAGELAATPRLPRPRTEAYIAMLERCAQWIPPLFPLTGSDVLASGVPEGPGVGDVLRRIEGWWENSGYQASRQDCLDRLMKETADTAERDIGGAT